MKKLLKKKVKAKLYDGYLYLYKSTIVFLGFTGWQWSRICIMVVT